MAGVLSSFAVIIWLSIGSMLVPPFTSALPPGPTDGCAASNITFIQSYNISDDIEQSLTPLQTFYQLSFNYYGIFGIILTLISGCAVSLITSELNFSRN